MTTRPHICSIRTLQGQVQKENRELPRQCREGKLTVSSSRACAFLAIFAAVASFALSVFAANTSDLTPSQTLLSMKVAVAF